jgi:hypothetical protein
MDPMELGEKVLAAVEADQFFIVTHPEFRELVRQRNDAMVNSFDGEAPPEVIEMMNAMVKPF